MGGSFGAPKITQQPKDVTAFQTQTTTFSIGAEGAAPLAFQWKRNGVAITGATEPSYTTPALTLADSGAKFSITITNGSGSVTSTEATLTVQGPPAITTQPVAVSVNVGATAAFSVTATGNSLAYQWLKDDVVISGATSATYTTAATVAADDGAYYSVAVSNGAGIVISTPVLLTVASVPAVTAQPVSQVAAEGDAVLFGVYAIGGNLAYQWKRNGVNIAGATARRYSLAASVADSGATFSVAVTNTLGTATSSAATLTVAARAASAKRSNWACAPALHQAELAVLPQAFKAQHQLIQRHPAQPLAGQRFGVLGIFILRQCRLRVEASTCMSTGHAPGGSSLP
jgi:hypothetical protein